jgi:hypothetical protein
MYLPLELAKQRCTYLRKATVRPNKPNPGHLEQNNIGILLEEPWKKNADVWRVCHSKCSRMQQCPKRDSYYVYYNKKQQVNKRL